jgi:hypothetical protein
MVDRTDRAPHAPARRLQKEGGRTIRTKRIRGRTKAAGAAFLVTIIFVALFACMAVALATTSNMNLLVSRNRLESNQASVLVETGLFLAQKELGGAPVSGDSASDVHAALASHLHDQLTYSNTLDPSAITASEDGVTFPPITLVRDDGRTGTVELGITADGGVESNPTIEIAATGRFGNAVRTAYYNLAVKAGGPFSEFGIVSKARIVMANNALVQGANTDAEGSIFSSSDSQYAIDMSNNATVSGNAGVTGEDGSIRLLNNAAIHGDQSFDQPEPEWPEIDISGFEQYVEQTVTGDVTGDQTLHNIRIPAGTNPRFTGNISIYGIVYIESPNTVEFGGNTNICGMIVTEEPPVENFNTNQIQFQGNVAVSGVESLPDDSRYDGLRDQTGTFMLAPGFQTRFSGNFNTIAGAMAAGQFIFSGNASGTIGGGLMNLSDANLLLKGSANLTIDRQNADPTPVGFGTAYRVVCVTGSYKD